jgi:anti-sigma factor RsiW
MTPEDDALLVAFLDNALGNAEREGLVARLAEDADLKARLEQMRAGGLSFAPAFAALLAEAPLDRLRAFAAVPKTPVSPSRTMRPGRQALVAAAAVALLLVGFAVGRLTQGAAESEQNWRGAVAEYMSLYTADTFAGTPNDPALQAGSLKAVGLKIGMPLTPERVAVANLPFKLAILLSYDQTPLGELVYLDPLHGPVLFCIIANAQADAPLSNSTMRGFPAASWQRGGRGFMVIGQLPPQRIAEIATELQQRF